MKIFLSILLNVLLVTSASVSIAQVSACDQLAGSPFDKEKKTEGVSFGKLNAAQAIPACKQAVQTTPLIGRLWFQYGRALEKGGDLSEAIRAYQKASELSHAAAFNNLGELYRDGKGFKKDAMKAQELFQQAAQMGSDEGKENLYDLQIKLITNVAPTKDSTLLPKELQGKWGKNNCSKRAIQWYGWTISSQNIIGTQDDYGVIAYSPEKITLSANTYQIESVSNRGNPFVLNLKREGDRLVLSDDNSQSKPSVYMYCN
jgi:TPR repeat protein